MFNICIWFAQIKIKFSTLIRLMSLSLIRLARCQLIVAFVYTKLAISALLVDLSVCLSIAQFEFGPNAISHAPCHE